MTEVKHTEFTLTHFPRRQVIEISEKGLTYRPIARLSLQEYAVNGRIQRRGLNSVEEMKSFAEFIVRACNSHYKLLGRLKHNVQAMDMALRDIKFCKLQWVSGTALEQDIEWTKKAIAEAEGK